MSSANRVAALYDVHGNLPALEAALADAASAEVDLFVLGGDLALGPMPGEVLDCLMQLGSRARYLRGNCDRLMVDAYDGRPLMGVPGPVQNSIIWAARQLRPWHRDFLADLPETFALRIDGRVRPAGFSFSGPLIQNSSGTRRSARRKTPTPSDRRHRTPEE